MNLFPEKNLDEFIGNDHEVTKGIVPSLADSLAASLPVKIQGCGCLFN